jgi:hypothetical protein
MWYSVFPRLTDVPGPGDYDLSVSNGTPTLTPVEISDH